ncbi:MAG: hypothetical protein KJO81_01410 [Gammaproteobacteria bacterium]|nr:hypothetical protein [Gammaproteobacteria bacterium]
MKIKFMCNKHLSAVKSCNIFKLHNFWTSWIEVGLTAYQNKDFSKSLFYFGNARDVSVAEFAKKDFLIDSISHLTTSSLLTARIFNTINQYEMEQLCLSETFQFLGKKLHLSQHLTELDEAMRALLDSKLHVKYINDALKLESIAIVYKIEPQQNNNYSLCH